MCGDGGRGCGRGSIPKRREVRGPEPSAESVLKFFKEVEAKLNAPKS
jgi:hypothetical protein